MSGSQFAKAAAKAIAKIPGARDARTYANADVEGYAFVKHGRRVADQHWVDPREALNVLGRERMLSTLRALTDEARAA